jgi:hypothetical protein
MPLNAWIKKKDFYTSKEILMHHKNKIKNVVTSMKNTHPYESVAYSVLRMEEI